MSDELLARVTSVIAYHPIGVAGSVQLDDAREIAQAVIDDLGLVFAEQNPHAGHDCWLDDSTDQGHQPCPDDDPPVTHHRAVGAWQEVPR